MNGADDFSYDSSTAPAGALFVGGKPVSPVFPSARAAERVLNPIYAENRLSAYGREGQPYKVERRGRRVIIKRAEEPDSPNELRALLLNHLREVGQPADEQAPLAELVDQVWRLERDFWRNNDPHGDRFGSWIPWWGV